MERYTKKKPTKQIKSNISARTCKNGKTQSREQLAQKSIEFHSICSTTIAIDLVKTWFCPKIKLPLMKPSLDIMHFIFEIPSNQFFFFKFSVLPPELIIKLMFPNYWDAPTCRREWYAKWYQVEQKERKKINTHKNRYFVDRNENRYRENSHKNTITFFYVHWIFSNATIWLNVFMHRSCPNSNHILHIFFAEKRVVNELKCNVRNGFIRTPDFIRLFEQIKVISDVIACHKNYLIPCLCLSIDCIHRFKMQIFCSFELQSNVQIYIYDGWII